MEIMYTFPTLEKAVKHPLLPDPFMKPDGKRVESPEEWKTQREYLKAMLSHYLYGQMPPAPVYESNKVLARGVSEDGKRIEEDVEVFEKGNGVVFSFRVRVVRPSREGIFPVIVLGGGKDWPSCPVTEEVTDRGYAVVYFDREEFAPDHENYKEGICGKVYPDYSWRAIAMWAWGASRVVDYLLHSKFAFSGKIVIAGHSRCGKAAMCAAIYDERFAACVSAGSGMGGGGLMRVIGDRYGERHEETETWGSMTFPERFWYWFAPEGAEFGNHKKDFQLGNEEYLPFDLHFLRAAIAPRPLLNVEGLDDNLWGNTLGTLISWRAGAEVYDFLDAKELTAIHFREGGHEFSAEDWKIMLDFLDVTLKEKEKKENWKTAGVYDKLLRCDWKKPE